MAEHVVATGPGGVLQQEDGLRVEQVDLTLAPPLVFATYVETPVCGVGGVARPGGAVPGRHLGGNHVEADAADPGDRAREVLLDQTRCQADRLEDLGPGVGGDRADAHLRHHLEDALAHRLDVVADRDGRLDAGQAAARPQVVDRLEGQVRIDCRGAVTDQQGDVVHLAAIAGLDDEPDLGAGAVADQRVVHGRGQQQGRDRREVDRGVTVGEHHDPGAVLDRL